MKNLKNNRWFAGIAMIVLLLGVFFAVKAIENKTQTKKIAVAEQWFEYTGPDQTRSEIEKVSNYQPLTSTPECNAGSELCSIHAPNNGSDQPVLSSNFVEQIMDALDSEAPTGTIKLEN